MFTFVSVYVMPSGGSDRIAEFVLSRFPLGVYLSNTSLEDALMNTSPKESSHSVPYTPPSLFFKEPLSPNTLLTHSPDEVNGLVHVFLSAIQYNFGDQDRCAAFIMHNQTILKLLIAKNVIDMVAEDTISNQEPRYETLTAATVSIFFPEQHTEEQSKQICSAISSITCSCSVWDTIIMLFAGNASKVDKDLAAYNMSNDRFNGIQSLCDYVKKITLFPCMQSCGIGNSSAQSQSKHIFPCKSLTSQYREILQEAHDHAFYGMTSHDFGPISRAIEKTLRHSFKSEVLFGMNNWKGTYDQFIEWEKVLAERKSVTLATLQNIRFQEISSERAQYEKAVNSEKCSVSTWIEYIMWEYSALKILITDLQENGLMGDIIPTLEIRPFILCNRAIVNLKRLNVAKSLLCATMSLNQPENRVPKDILREKFASSWAVCEPILQNLYLSRSISQKSLQRAFMYSSKQDFPFQCTFITEIPLWNQFIALLRIYIKKLSKEPGKKLRSAVAYFIENTVSCIYRVFKSFPIFDPLWAECSALLHEFNGPFRKVMVESGVKLSNDVKADILDVQHAMLDGSNQKNEEEKLYRAFPTSVIAIKGLALISQKKLIPDSEVQSFGIVHALLFMLLTRKKQCTDANASPDFFHTSSLIQRTTVGFYDFFKSFSTSKNEVTAAPLSFKDELYESFQIISAIDDLLATISEKLGEENTLNGEPLHIHPVMNYISDLFDNALYGYDKVFSVAMHENERNTHSANIDLDKRKKQFRTACGEKMQNFIRCFCKNNSESRSEDLRSAISSLESVVRERVNWEILQCIVSFDQATLHNPCRTQDKSGVDTHIASEIIFDLIHRMFEKSIEIHDEMRVSLQSNNLDSWVYSRGAFLVQFQIGHKEAGIPFVYICNIPTNSDIAAIRSWMHPFTFSSISKIKRQKNQLIVLIEMQSVEDAIQCSEHKNRSTWEEEGRLRRISVQKVKSREELSKIGDIFKQGSISEKKSSKKFKSSSGTDKISKPHDQHSPKTNDFFTRLFSRK